MFREEGYRFMGAAFEVYNQLGYGLAETVYQESLEIELELRQIPFEARPPIVMTYKGRQLATHYKPDLFVCDGIVVELKAVSQLVSEHEAQLFNYLRITQRPVGYLLNFGCKEQLQWKRFVITQRPPPSADASVER